MEISPTTPTQAASKRSEAIEPAKTDGNAMAGDFQTFLTLLTTQMKNQDPLKPMESTEFVAQLATFSSVEQQVKTNDRLKEIFESLASGSTGGLAAWIGKEVRAPAQVNFTGVPIAIEATPLADAESAVLVVTDDFDKVVARRAVDPKATSLSWDGKTELGASLPVGGYRFSVESFKADGLAGTSPGLVYDKVREVRLEDGSPFLLLEGGSKVGVDDVSALR